MPDGATGRQQAVQAIRDLAAAVTRYIDARQIYPRQNVYGDAVLLALLSKALSVAGATAALVEAGFDEEAFATSCTLIELALSVRYITNQGCDARAKQFVEFFAKDHEQWVKLIAKYYPNAPIRSDPEHAEMMQVASRIHDPHRWTGRPARDMAMEEPLVPICQVEAEPAWAFDYELVYKWTSQYVHATVSALERHALAPLQPFRVAAGVEHVAKAGPALFNVAAFLYKTWLRVGPALGLAAQELASDFDAAMERVRNW